MKLTILLLTVFLLSSCVSSPDEIREDCKRIADKYDPCSYSKCIYENVFSYGQKTVDDAKIAYLECQLAQVKKCR